MLSSLYATRAHRDNDGFTLIELLIVVIIIGLLAAIALPIFIDQQKVAVDASVKSDVRNTVTNVTNAQAQATAFPASAKAAVSGANTNVALKVETAGGTTEVASRSTTTTLGNVPALGTAYSVHGWNAGGKLYLGTADAGKGAYTFNSASGLFSQATGVAPNATSGGADADGGTTGGTVGGTAQSAPVWTTTTLPSGKVGTAYSYQLQTTATPGATYALASDSAALPAGLSLSNSGLLAGNPTASANVSGIKVVASNVKGSVTQTFQLIIDPSGTVLASYDFENGSLGDWASGDTYYVRSVDTIAGRKAMRVSSNGKAAGTNIDITNDSGNTSILLTAGKTYTISAYIYVASAETPTYKSFVFHNSIYNGNASTSSSRVTTSGSWQKVTQTFTQTGSNARGYLYWRTESPTTRTNIDMYIDDITVVES